MAKDKSCDTTADEGKMAKFTLIAQDITSPPVIVEWIKQNINNLECSDEKLTEAFVLALQMRKFPKRKKPD